MIDLKGGLYLYGPKRPLGCRLARQAASENYQLHIRTCLAFCQNEGEDGEKLPNNGKGSHKICVKNAKKFVYPKKSLNLGYQALVHFLFSRLYQNGFCLFLILFFVGQQACHQHQRSQHDHLHYQ